MLEYYQDRHGIVSLVLKLSKTSFVIYQTVPLNSSMVMRLHILMPDQRT